LYADRVFAEGLKALEHHQEQVQAALSRARIYTFSQDVNLRYTAMSSPMFGHSPEEIIGRTDSEIVPPGNDDVLTQLKREVIEFERPVDSQFSIVDGASTRWFDLHIEPLRDGGGAVIGLTGAAVDVTDHKQNEAHLRMLMRELTHRSKNLLAVIQAMARQTARHSESIDAFLDHFGARLQALATSHDLLVQESWHGVSLNDLVQRQLGPYLNRSGSELSVAGPAIVLKPEAAQSLGLALHELATNAANYGALSVPAGKVLVNWLRMPPADGYGLELTWVEQSGPAVSAPSHRGFGSMVIERNLARSLDAEVEWTFAPDGLRCRIVLPITQLVVETAQPAEQAADGATQ
jgi:PAS domain S-box-containing protein